MTAKPAFVLGLTGSIGMGKSTTAGFFREFGVPVWDADAAVHRLYAPGGAALNGIRAIHASAVDESGVNREVLREWIACDDSAIGQIESVVHPLVAEDRKSFLRKCERQGHDLVVLDIPLLFETGGDAKVDATLVVTTSHEEQKKRVLGRNSMTSEQFEKILQAQMPDAEKRARADFVIETQTPQQAKSAVESLLKTLKRRDKNHA